jgi:hypothetical protein
MSYRIVKSSVLASVLALSAMSAGCRSPLPPSSGLFPGSIVITPGGAIVGTSVTFESKGAYIYEPNAKPRTDTSSMTFSWNFGDGAFGSGATVTHTYAIVGTFRPTVTVDDGMGRSATATLSVAVRDLTDTWYPDASHPLLGTHPQIAVTQNGFGLSGTYVDDSGYGTVAGTVSPMGMVTLTVSLAGIEPITFTGTAGRGTDTLDGTASGAGFVNLRWVMFRPHQ